MKRHRRHGKCGPIGIAKAVRSPDCKTALVYYDRDVVWSRYTADEILDKAYKAARNDWLIKRYNGSIKLELIEGNFSSDRSFDVIFRERLEDNTFKIRRSALYMDFGHEYRVDIGYKFTPTMQDHLLMEKYDRRYVMELEKMGRLDKEEPRLDREMPDLYREIQAMREKKKAEARRATQKPVPKAPISNSNNSISPTSQHHTNFLKEMAAEEELRKKKAEESRKEELARKQRFEQELKEQEDRRQKRAEEIRKEESARKQRFERELREQEERRREQKNAVERRKFEFHQKLNKLQSDIDDRSGSSSHYDIDRRFRELEESTLEYCQERFYIMRGNFYHDCAVQTGNQILQKTLYSKASADYRKAIQHSPFAENVAERIQYIDEKLRLMEVRPKPSAQERKVETRSPKRVLPQSLTPEQRRIIDEKKAVFRKQYSASKNEGERSTPKATQLRTPERTERRPIGIQVVSSANLTARPPVNKSLSQSRVAFHNTDSVRKEEQRTKEISEHEQRMRLLGMDTRARFIRSYTPSTAVHNSHASQRNSGIATEKQDETKKDTNVASDKPVRKWPVVTTSSYRSSG